MQQYTEMEDEQLVALFQDGDDDAFTELFHRYDGKLKRMSENASKRFPSYYEDEFYGYFQERFVKMVQDFDTSRGVYFAYFCKFKFPKMAHDYVRRDLFPRDKDGNRYEAPRDKYKMLTTDFASFRMTDKHFIPNILHGTDKDEFFRYLTEKDPMYKKVVVLIANGYSYSEIAEQFGKTGNDAALRNWTARIVRKIKDETIRFYTMCGCIDEIRYYVN